MNRLLAQVDINPALSSTKTVRDNFPTIGSFITILLRNSLTIIGIILLVLLIVGGFMFIANAGSNDSKKIAQSQALITDAIIGFVVVLLAFSIIQIIQVVTGLNILTPSL